MFRQWENGDDLLTVNLLFFREVFALVKVQLTYFQQLFHFHTPWRGFLIFSGDMQVEYWLKIG